MSAPAPVNEELTALLRGRPVGPDDVIQVVLTPAWRRAMEAWLASHGSGLFQIPSEDPIPTFGISHD